jgi:hypothetical protein
MYNKNRQELITEKRKLTNRLKDFNTNDLDRHCIAVQVIVKRIVNINEILTTK